LKEVEFEEGFQHWILWRDKETKVVVQRRTNWPAKFGGHIVVEQHKEVSTPYEDYPLFSKMSVIAATVQKSLEKTGLASHANIQSNANWAFRTPTGEFREIKEGQEHRRVHIHVYGRTMEDPGWGEPIRPAYWEGQQIGQKYWGQVWSKEKMNKLATFLEKEIPRALKTLKK